MPGSFAGSVSIVQSLAREVPDVKRRVKKRAQLHEDFALNGDAFLPDGNMSVTPEYDAEQRTRVFFLVM